MFREFDEATYPEILAEKIVSSMSRRFSNPELKKIDIARILTGFYSMRVTSGKNIDALYFSYIKESVITSGKFSESEVLELLTTLPKDGYAEFVPLEDIGTHVQKLKEQGLNVGLKFGHYRRLTLNHIFEFVYAGKGCDHMVLIIESGERTSKFKNKRIELSDEQRINMFKNSCLVQTLGITSGLDYSNAYYRDLVAEIKPTTLFIPGSWPEDVQNEYKERARLSGAEPLVLPNLIPMTTTMLEKFIF